MNKYIKSVMILMLVTMMIGTASAGVTTVTWSEMSNFVADDSTPNIPFNTTEDTANCTHYLYTLYLNISGVWTAAGSVNAAVDTSNNITCTYTLDPWTTYQYNITAYNVSDTPTTHTSSTYTVRYSSFSMLATMVTDIVDIFSAMTGLVIVIIVIMVVLAIAGGLVGGFGGLFDNIFNLIRFKK